MSLMTKTKRACTAGQHQCSYCGAFLTSKNNLDRHTRLHCEGFRQQLLITSSNHDSFPEQSSINSLDSDGFPKLHPPSDSIMMMSHVSSQSTNNNEEVDFQSSSQFSHSAEEPEYDDSSVDDISSSENEISSFCDNDVDEDSQHSVCSVLSNRPSEIAALVTNQLSALAIIEDSSSDSDSNDDNILEVGFNLYGRSSDLEDPPQDSIMILPDTTSPDIAAESAPIHVVEAKLLHMMTKYSVPLHVYPKLMEWAKEVACTPNYDFQKPSTFASTMKKLTSHHSMSHNVANVVVVEVDDYPEASFNLVGSIDDAIEKGKKLMAQAQG